MIQQILSKLPLHLYGVDSSKTINRLCAEIEKGESEIIWESDRPIRLLKVVRVRVVCSELELELYEDRQQFTNGRIRRRGLWGVSDKILPGELSDDAARRALRKELGLAEEAIASMDFTETNTSESESPSYPGLLTRYAFYDYIADIRLEAYKEEYFEQQTDKTTYFVWK